ncbi:MAG TPA: hypothetical protein VD932_03660 [Aquabacterium sp.]|nr:hypothetical protein [Aquabacterium sp.]
MANDGRARLAITAEDLTRRAWDSAAATARAGSSKIKSLVLAAIPGGSLLLAANQLKKVVQQSFEFAEAIGGAAIKSGLSTEAISQLAFAAKGANVELADLSKSIGTMQINISKAAAGSKPLLDSFQELGVNFSKLQELRPDVQFEILAEALNRVPNEADRARLATELFGKSGAQLLPLFSEGAEGIRKARKESESLGLSLSREKQRALQEAGDAIVKLGQAARGAGTDIGYFFSFGIKSLAEGATKLIEAARGGDQLIELIKERAEVLQRLKEASEGFTFRELIGGTDEDKQRLIAIEDTLRSINFQRTEENRLLREKRAIEQAALGGPPVELPELGALNIGLLSGPDPDVRDALDKARENRELELGGEDARLRVTERATGGRAGVSDASRERLLEEEREYFDNLKTIVEQKAEETAGASEAVLDEYFGRLEEKSRAQSDVLRGAAEELGRSIQSSLSDVFLNAGKGADGFADSVLNAFKRILADQAANKVVELLGGLFGAKKDPGVGGGASGGAGFLATIATSLFGGARAAGGPVSPGKAFLVGERGPELFIPKQSGGILPNGVGAGGMMVTIDGRVSIDARGATRDGAEVLMSQLPEILRQRDDRLKGEIAQLIKRRQPPFV